MVRTQLALIATVAILSACKAGPDYKGPPVSASGAAARSAFLRGDGDGVATAPVARWWMQLGDPALDRLVDDALAHAPSIAVAQARIAQARAGLSASRTALLPSIGATFVAPYLNLPSGALGLKANSGDRVDSSSYTLGFDASWEADLFGGNRRQLESAAATAGAAEAALADVKVSLAAEVARAYVALRLRQVTAVAQEQQVMIDRILVQLAEQRFQAGTTPAQPLDQARGQLARDSADLVRSRAEATVLLDQIAVLTGREPGALDADLAAPAAVPLPPAKVAVGDPAALLRQRPDIRMAERRLAAATADVGVKISARFPQVRFVGILGLGGTNIGDVVDPTSLLGLVLPQIRWSIFDGGRAAAETRAARAARDEAEARYRNTVLSALQDAENSLARFGALRIAYAEALEARDRAGHAADLEQQRSDAGAVGRASGLDARRQAVLADIANISARAELTMGFVAVQKALGLGWAPER